MIAVSEYYEPNYLCIGFTEATPVGSCSVTTLKVCSCENENKDKGSWKDGKSQKGAKKKKYMKYHSDEEMTQYLKTEKDEKYKRKNNGKELKEKVFGKDRSSKKGVQRKLNGDRLSFTVDKSLEYQKTTKDEKYLCKNDHKNIKHLKLWKDEKYLKGSNRKGKVEGRDFCQYESA